MPAILNSIVSVDAQLVHYFESVNDCSCWLRNSIDFLSFSVANVVNFCRLNFPTSQVLTILLYIFCGVSTKLWNNVRIALRLMESFKLLVCLFWQKEKWEFFLPFFSFYLLRNIQIYYNDRNSHLYSVDWDIWCSDILAKVPVFFLFFWASLFFATSHTVVKNIYTKKPSWPIYRVFEN